MYGMDPKQMAKLMKQMGIKVEELDAEEVIIRLKDKELILPSPSVSKIEAQGQINFTISGPVEERPRISEDDLQIIMEKTGVSKEKAKEALENSNGDIAEAIISLQEE